MTKYSSETLRQVWNDETGEVVEIGPDRDGLGLVEIRIRNGNHIYTSRLSMPVEVWDRLRTYKLCQYDDP